MEYAIKFAPQWLNKLRLAVAGFILLNLVSIYQLLQLAYGSGTFLGHYRKLRILQITPIAGLAMAGLLVLVLADSEPYRKWMGKGFENFRRRLSALGRGSWLLFLILVVIYPLLIISPFWPAVQHYFPGIWVWAMISLAGAACLYGTRREIAFLPAWAATLAVMAAIYTLSFYAITVSSDPFSLGWSESSQIYFASTFLSRSIYGFWAPLPVIQPGYELLMSLPYLINGLPIWVHRLWLVLLWTGFTLGTSLAISRNLRITGGLQRMVFVAWAFTYLLNIPVYFHLLASVFLVFFGFASNRPAARWAAVLAASAWAGVCRINWFPLPGMLAAVIYILENQWKEQGWRYFIQPAVWIAGGTATAFLVNTIYMAGSRNPLYYFSSTFTSALLWYRLFPSATNPTGVLNQVLIYSLPLVGLLVYMLLRGKAWHPARLAGIGAILVVFFAGGLVVSAKIGGGNNIHNLDAFFTLLMVVTAYTVFDRFSMDEPKFTPVQLPSKSIALAVASLPLIVVLSATNLTYRPPRQGTAQAIATIQSYVNRASQQPGKEILFTTERQLLSLGLVKIPKLIPEYEKWFLMEMAMGENQPYYSQFHTDIRSHRFSLIVSEPLQLALQGRDYPFGEENDVFVKNVSQWVLEEYTPVISMPEYGVTLYEPKK